MTKHTPGPWARGGDCDDWDVSPPRRVSLASSQPITAKGRKDPVCYIVQRDKREYGDGDAEFGANADLIAAAPDLLAVLAEYLMLGAGKCTIGKPLADKALAAVKLATEGR